jgi:hypothetical protein
MAERLDVALAMSALKRIEDSSQSSTSIFAAGSMHSTVLNAPARAQQGRLSWRDIDKDQCAMRFDDYRR